MTTSGSIVQPAATSASRVESIERIDLTGSGDNSLVLAVADVLDLAEMNRINSGSMVALGWSDAGSSGGEDDLAHGVPLVLS